MAKTKSKYVYRGRSKVISQIPKVETGSKILIDSCSFLIIASSPMANVKMLGCPLINDQYDDEVLNLYLDGIQSICKNPNIIISAGFQSKKILKHRRRAEYSVIENLLYELTNSAEDLRLGLNGTRSTPLAVFDAHFIPSYTSMELLFETQKESSMLWSRRKIDTVGCDINDNDLINFYGFKCSAKLKGAYFLSHSDADKMRKRIVGSTFNRNKFDYEMLTELRMRAKEDNSTSSRLDENSED